MTFRKATRDDLPAIVHLLAEDELGRQRESDTSPLPVSYIDAFEAVDLDPNNELIVVELEGAVIGTLQLTFIPYLTHRGGWRALVEGVRIDQKFRSHGIGKKVLINATNSSCINSGCWTNGMNMRLRARKSL